MVWEYQRREKTPLYIALALVFIAAAIGFSVYTSNVQDSEHAGQIGQVNQEEQIDQVDQINQGETVVNQVEVAGPSETNQLTESTSAELISPRRQRTQLETTTIQRQSATQFEATDNILTAEVIVDTTLPDDAISFHYAQDDTIKSQSLVVQAQNLPEQQAEITLNYVQRPTHIARCANFDTQTQTCPEGWEKTDIPFTIDPEENTVTFQVDGFSAYVVIIEITDAIHLDQDRNELQNIFAEVSQRDNVWSPTINDEEYVRVAFEERLQNFNDITVYPRIVSGNPSIDVLYPGTDRIVATFATLQNNSKNTVILEQLQAPLDVFDLRITGGNVEFDLIIDPTLVTTTNAQQAEFWDAIAVAENKVAVVWCNDDDDDLHGLITNFDGTIVVAETDIDADVGLCLSQHALDVDVINTTHFIVAYRDSTDTKAATVAISNLGVRSSFTVNVSDYMVGVSVMNKSHIAFVYGDNTAANAKIMDDDGNTVVNSWQIDDDYTNFGTAPLSQDVEAFNETHFLVGWADQNSREVKFAVYDTQGNTYTSPVSEKTTSGFFDEVRVSVVNETDFLLSYFDSSLIQHFDRYYQSNGNARGSTFGGIPQAFVYLLDSARLNDTHMITSWPTSGGNQQVYKTIGFDGNTVDVNDSALNAGTSTIEIVTTDYHSNISICENGFAFVHANTSNMGLNISTFYYNLSSWDGSCSGVSVPFDVGFVDPTLADGASTGNDYIYVNVSVNTSDSKAMSFVDFNNDLVFWYRMDHISGTTVYDNSSYKNNGTEVGDSTFQAGYFGDGVSFDGSSDRITVPNPSQIHGSSELTICSWVYLDTLGSSSSDDGSIYSETSATGDRILFWYNYDQSSPGDNTYSFNVGDSGVAANRVSAPAGTALVTTWQHVCGVMNGSVRQMYVNGTMVEEGTIATDTTVPSVSDDGYIGGWVGSGNFDLAGDLDEVMMWSRALDATEISALYNTTATNYEQNFTSLSEGSYTFTAYALDESNAGSDSRTVTYAIPTEDATPPDIEFVNQTPADGATITENYAYINISSNDTNSHYVINDWNRSLVLWMRMNNRSGSTVFDESTYGNDGTFGGDGTFETSTGPYGTFLNQTGVSISSSHRIDVTDADSLDVDELTVAMWVMRRGSEVFYYLIDKKRADDAAFAFLVDGFSSHRFAIEVGNGSSSARARFNYAVPLNEWVHLAASYNATGTDNFRGWVNGEEVSILTNQLDDVTGSIGANTRTLRVANRLASTYRVWDGLMDEVMIFNRPLSDQEIKALYNATEHPYFRNFTGLQEQTYNFTAHAVDNNSNKNSTETRFVTYSAIPPDTTSPSITFVDNTPPNNTYANDFSVNVSSQDAATHYTLLNFNNSIDLWARFDDYNGSAYYDLGQYNKTLSLTGATVSSGRFGNALNKASAGQYAEAVITNLEPSGQFTFGTWYNPSSTGIILETDEVGNGYTLELVTGNRIRCTFNGLSPSQILTPSISLNEWQHTMCAYNGTHTLLYHNATLINSTAVSGSMSYTSGFSFTIGASAEEKLDGITGLIDETLLIRRAISLEEAQSLYNATQYQLETSPTTDQQTYTYKAYAIDTSGNLNQTEERTVTIDNTLPTVDFIDPTPENNILATESFVEINLTTADTNNHYTLAELNNDIQLWVNFDNYTGTNPTDLSSYARSITWENDPLNFTDGPFGRAITNGSQVTDRLNIPAGDYLNLTNNTIALSFWMRGYTAGSTTGLFDSLIGINDNRWRFFLFTNGAISLALTNDTTTEQLNFNINTEGRAGTWQHYVFVMENDGTTTHVRGYNDGVNFQNRTYSIAGNIYSSNGGSNTAAILDTQNVAHADVDLDEFIMIHRNLSDAEVLALYNATANQFYANISGLVEGNNNYTGYVVDQAANFNQTSRVITVDTTLPTIDFVDPTPANDTSTSNTSFVVNVSVSDENDRYAFIDFNASLMGWWRLNNDSNFGESNTLVYDYSENGNNATPNGATPTTDGRIQGAYSFDGSNDDIEPISNVAFPDETTVSAWFKANEVANQNVFTWRSSNSNYFHIRLASDNDVHGWMRNTTGNDGNSIPGQYTVGQWHHVVLWFNGTHRMTCLDGTCTAKDQPPYITTGTVDFIIGDGVYQLNGSVDEVLLFDRALSDTEVTALYNATSPLYQNFTNLPAGTHNFTAYSVDFAGNQNETETRFVTVQGPSTDITSCTALDQANTAYTVTQDLSTTGSCLNITATNVTLNIDGYSITGDGNSQDDFGIHVVAENVTVANGTIQTFGRGIVVEAANPITQNLTILGTSSTSSTHYGIIFQSVTNGLISDVNVSYGPDSAIISVGIAVFGNNSIIQDTHVHAINASSLGFGILTASNNLQLLRVNLTNIEDRAINFNDANHTLINDVEIIATQEAFDTSFQASNITINNTLFSEITDHILSLTSSSSDIFLNNSRITNSESATHLDDLGGVTGITVQDTNIDSYNFGSGTTGFTYINTSNAVVAFTGDVTGTGNISSNLNTSFNLVSVNSTSGLNTSANITLFNIPVFVDAAILYNNQTECTAASTPACTNLTPLSGTVEFNVSHWSNYTIGSTPDTTPPTIQLHNPVNNTNTTNTWVNFNWTATDSKDTELTCTLYINDQANQSNIASTNNTATQYNVTNFEDGTYTWNVGCVDDNNNAANSTQWIFTVDTTAPVVTLNTPTNGSIILFDWVNFNWTATDNLDEELTCIIYINDTQNQTAIASANNTPTQYNVTSFIDSSYSWNVACVDNHGNAANSTQQLFTINAVDETLLTSCGTLDQPNTVYTVVQDLTTTGTCLNITATNVTLNIDGYLITGDGNSQDDFGVHVYANNVTVANGTIRTFGRGIYGEQNHTTISNITVRGENSTVTTYYAIIVSDGFDTHVYNVNISGTPTGTTVAGGIAIYGDTLVFENSSISKIDYGLARGLYTTSERLTVRNVNISHIDDEAIIILGTNHTVFNNIRVENATHGFNTQTYIQNVTVNNSYFDSISSVVMQTSSSSTDLTINNSLVIDSDSSTHLQLPAGHTGITIQDTNIDSYNFNSGITDLIYHNTSTGKVTYLESVNGSGNFSVDLNITYNLVAVAGSSGLNRSANVTLYNIPSIASAAILYNNQTACTQTTTPQCYNFTTLNGTVQFNVSEWSFYTIDSNLLGLTECWNLDQNNTQYRLGGNIVTTSTCFNVTGTNVSFDLAGFDILSTNLAHTIYGINVEGGSVANLANGTITDFGRAITTNRQFTTINNITAQANGAFSSSQFVHGVYSSGTNTTITRSNLYNIQNTDALSGARGVYFLSDGGTIANTRIDGIDATFFAYGVQIAASDILLSNVSINDTRTNAINVGSGDQITIFEANISNGATGINFGTAISSKTIINHTNITEMSTASISDPSSEDTTLHNSRLTDTFDRANVGNLILIDTIIDEYSFTSHTGLFSVENTTHGKINFTENIGTASGDEFNAEFVFAFNFTSVNASKTDLNKTAIIDLYGLPTTYNFPAILRDGEKCASDLCTNLTVFNSVNMQFNVSDWGAYSIGETYDIDVCGTLSESTTYTLDSSVSTAGDCFNITADNVIFNLNNFRIDGDGNSEDDYGITIYNVDNVKVENGSITDFGRGVWVPNTSNTTLRHLTINFTSNSLPDADNIYGIDIDSGIDINISNITHSNNSISSFDIVHQGMNIQNVDNVNVTDTTFWPSQATDPGITLSFTGNNSIFDNLVFTDLADYLSVTGTNITISNYVANDSNALQVTSTSQYVTIENVSGGGSIRLLGTDISVNNVTGPTNSILVSGNRINISNAVFASESTTPIFLNGNAGNILFTNVNATQATGSDNDLITNSYSSTEYVTFNNSIINNYSLDGTNRFQFYQSNGMITFLESIVQSGTNLSSDIRIAFNSTYVNASKSGLNISANVTLYNLPANYTNPSILKNNITCTTCTNLTPLNQATVIFNVTEWSIYSIGEDFTIEENLPTLGFISPTPNSTTVNATTVLGYNNYTVNVSSSDASTHYVATVTNNDVKLWLRMDNRSGATVFDESGQANHGTANGVYDFPVKSNIYGDSFITYNGGNGYIEVPADNSLNVQNITLSAWVYPTQLSSTGAFIDRNMTNGATYGFGYNALASDFYFTLRLEGTESTSRSINSDSNPSVAQWYHLVGTYDGRTVKFYINGVQQSDTVEINGTIDTDNSGVLLIGRNQNGNKYTPAKYDEIILYNRALGLREIQALYNASQYQYYHNFTNVTDGNYSFQAFAIDAFGNRNWTEIRNITINTTAPTITDTSPTTPLTINETDSQDFAINYTNPAANVLVRWYQNGTLVYTQAVSNATTSNYTWVGNLSAEGTYNISVNVSNAYGFDTYNWLLTANSVEAGTLTITASYSTTGIQREDSFTVTVNASCSTAQCSTVLLYLDPIKADNILYLILISAALGSIVAVSAARKHKSQGATEYIIIAGIALVVTGIVAGTLTGFGSLTTDAAERAMDTRLQNLDVAVTAHVLDTNTLRLDLRNTLLRPVRITEIIVGGTTLQSDQIPTVLQPGQETTMYSTSVRGAEVGARYALTYESTYADLETGTVESTPEGLQLIGTVGQLQNYEKSTLTTDSSSVPFYIDGASNVYNCGDLAAGGSCQTTFTVVASGGQGSYTFFAYATQSGVFAAQSETTYINIIDS